MRALHTFTSAAVGLALLLGAATAEASHRRDGALRLDIDVYGNGPARLPLKRLLRRQHHVELDNYRLAAVVIHSHRRSRGFARLSAGRFETAGHRLQGRHRVRIEAPPGRGRWQLHLSPGSRVRTVTAVLEPRRYRGWPDRHRRYAQHYRYHRDPFAPRHLIRQWENEQQRDQHRAEHRRERAWHGSDEPFAAPLASDERPRSRRGR